MNELLILGAVSGDGFVHSLIAFLVVGICALAIWAFGKWCIKKMEAPPHALTVWNGIFLLLGLLVLVNFLLSLIGKPLIRW